jgi:hypothetical protein
MFMEFNKQKYVLVFIVSDEVELSKILGSLTNKYMYLALSSIRNTFCNVG